jgi:hypothetical protein
VRTVVQRQKFAQAPMEQEMGKFSNYEYRKQPGFDMNTFEGAS